MSIEKKKDYNGQYNADQLLEQITLFFDYCAENKLKPTAPLLQLWLGVSKTTMNDWKGFPERYGEKSVVIRTAYSLMESYLQSNIDKYPTGSIFLLKTTHGHVEKSQVDITTNANFTDAELKDKVKQLGLDK